MKWLGHDQPEIDASADGHEKHGEQQALERIEIHFKFVAILTFSKHNARQKCSKRCRKTHELHEERNAHHDEKGEGHEYFADA